MHCLLQLIPILVIIQYVLSGEEVTSNVTVAEVAGNQTITNNTATVTELPNVTSNVTVADVAENQTVTNNAVTVTELPNVTNNVTVADVTVDQTVTNNTVGEHFVRNHLVPDIIAAAPQDLVEVTFPSGVKVTLGNKLTPTQVKDIPTVSYTASSEHYYTLIAVDPDQPERTKPVFRSTLQWCVVNIPGTNIASGETLAEYFSAVPSEKSGIHRFTFLVYKQPKIIAFNETMISSTTIAGRPSFSVTKFAKKYDLGNPVAGNFFRTSFDNYVPILYKKLGISSSSNTFTPEKMVIAILMIIFCCNSNFMNFV